MRLWKTAVLVLATIPAALAAGAGFNITLPAPYVFLLEQLKFYKSVIL